jgi:putative SOS response-associated peptidase YedK
VSRFFCRIRGAFLHPATGDSLLQKLTEVVMKSCTMIVTEPNEFAAKIHDRMPVFLTEQQFGPWLSGEAGAEYLKPAPDDYLQLWPVSKRVNGSKADADDPTLIESIHVA